MGEWLAQSPGHQRGVASLAWGLSSLFPAIMGHFHVIFEEKMKELSASNQRTYSLDYRWTTATVHSVQSSVCQSLEGCPGQCLHGQHYVKYLSILAHYVIIIRALPISVG